MKNNSINFLPCTFRFSHEAMATIFEIIIFHEDELYAKQAAWEAFFELDRLEQDLSRFVKNSDIARINNLAENESLCLGLAAFDCLQQCAILYEETGGAFDVTIGSLMNCWINKDKSLRNPSEEELFLSCQHTGMHQLQLDDTQYTVQLLTSPIHIDLGGFGKGYAVDKMAKLLLDWELDTFLIHGGKSSVLAVGSPPGKKGWLVSLSSPFNCQKTLDYIYLKDQAMGASGLQKGQHIIDPRTAQPIKKNSAAWAFAPTAAVSDALSTAFMIMSHDEINNYCKNHPDTKAMILLQPQNGDAEKDEILRYGQWEEKNNWQNNYTAK